MKRYVTISHLAMLLRRMALVVVLVLGSQAVSAQKLTKVARRVDSLLTLRYERANIDTNYVYRPKTKWTLVGRYNLTGSEISSEGVIYGQNMKTELEAKGKSTVTVGVSYLGISLNLSLNPAKLLGLYHDYELGFRSYGKRFGFDIAYQDAQNFKGWHEVNGERQDITTSDNLFRLRTFNVNTYFVFNHRRFSYPAAFAHSYIQRRSSGSFLLALSGQGQHGKADEDDKNTGANEPKKVDFKVTHIAFGAGYGYNFVPSQRWLLHLSVLPTLIIYSKSSVIVDDSDGPLHHRLPEGIITCRASIVKQFDNNMFAGLSGVYTTTRVGDNENLVLHNRKWLIRLYFGVRL